MKIKRILTLAAALLMVGTAVGCNNKPSSSEEVLTPEQTISEAADYLWQMYRARDNTEITKEFDVVNKVAIGKDIVAVTWTLDVTGSKDGYSITKKDDNYSTVVVNYKEGLITEDSSVKLTATLTLGETSKTLAEVFASEANKHAIDFTTPGLVLNNNEAYVAELKAEDVGLTATAQEKVTKTIKAKAESGSEVDVEIVANNLYINYGAVYLNKGIDNDTFVISAPVGYAITKLEVEAYNTYDNLNFHAGKDATAEAITEELVGDSAAKRGYYTLVPNSRHVTIDNPQSDYTGSFYNVKVTVAQAGPALQITSEDFGLTSTAQEKITKTEKAGNIDVTFTLNKLFIKYDAVYMDKNIDGDTFVISVPEGKKIVSLEVEAYGTYDNLNFHVGQDATGTALEEVMTSNKEAKRCYYVIEPNSQHVTIDNPQTDYTGSFYTVKVVVA